MAILWFGGLVNAINLLDNMDGLAAGVTAIGAAGLALTFAHELGPSLVATLVALAGALLGFLGWNRHPARMFMGNCGSLAIGGLSRRSATMAIARAGTTGGAAAALLILIVPIFDSSFVVLLRRLAGRSTTRGNIDHTSHRLVSAGFTDKTAVWLLYALGAVGAARRLAASTRTSGTAPLAVAVAVGTLMIGAVARARAGLRRAGLQGVAERAVRAAPHRSDVSLARRRGAARPGPDHDLLLRRLPRPLRGGPEPAGVPQLVRAIVAGHPRDAAGGTLRVGPLQTHVAHVRLHDVSTVVRAVGSGVILSVLVVTYLYKFEAFSRSVFVIYAVLLTAAIVATRSSFRVFGRMAARTAARTRVAIYGAGARGQLLAREIAGERRRGAASPWRSSTTTRRSRRDAWSVWRSAARGETSTRC